MEKSELLKYIGNLSQIGGCRHYTLSEGWGRGMRAVDINTGSGLHYTVLPDRGMDISLARYKDINLVYQTCNGETHPAFYEQEGLDGCGLLQVDCLQLADLPILVVHAMMKVKNSAFMEESQQFL